MDDYDLISALKQWQYHDDFVLKNLSDMIINRDLLKIKIKNKPIAKHSLTKHVDALTEKYNITEKEARYFVFTGEISNQAYQHDSDKINIIFKNGKVSEFGKASDHLNLKVLSKRITKYYICYPKQKL